ncbi:uncharacterized protein LOC131252172 [Magnolia sinica]|uniref:uncharacterized protein LOC131252172 n=1 Tax=Magnolia sinica TaxID=86752 RepID=UPI002659809A|nr:uncharacterized protein LOC131252172 [Magnolia sinica]
MGTLVGHVLPGLGFLLIGLWHLINHIKAHSINPNSYKSHPWFPTPILRHLELHLIMIGCTISIAMELFFGPHRHQPLNPDWTIPSTHLHNFDHALIAFSFFIYATFAIVLDRLKPMAHHDLTQLLVAAAFGQELLLFHLHSVDQSGIETQYHSLLQIIIFITLLTLVIGILLPNSFLISFVGSLSIFFQGVWLMITGFMLWTPQLLPKGCWLISEVGHMVARCTGDGALSRAIRLVNLLFSWCLASAIVFSVILYLVLIKWYGDMVEYNQLDGGDGDGDDEESQNQKKKNKKKKQQLGFVHMEKVAWAPVDIER